MKKLMNNETKEVNWLDKQVKNSTDERRELPDVIDSSYGSGLEFNDDKGIKYTTFIRTPRKIYVAMSSFIGISPEAIHYYAKVEFYETSMSFTDDKGFHDNCSIGGSFDKFKPVEMLGAYIRVKRYITEDELKDTDRWNRYDTDDLVDAFESEEVLKQEAIKLIKARFMGDWLIEFSDFDQRILNEKLTLKDL